MINSLRKRHRGIFGLLAIALPLLFIAALLARKPVPKMSEYSLATETDASGFPHLLYSSGDNFADPLIVTYLRSDSLPAANLLLQLDVKEHLQAPEPLLYWIRSSKTAEFPPPATAIFLGSIRGKGLQDFTLPSDAQETDGRLVIYSFPWKKAVMSATIPSAISFATGGR